MVFGEISMSTETSTLWLVTVDMSLVMRKPGSGFPTRFDTNRSVQSHKMARSLKFRLKEVEGLYYPYSETKALISFAVTAKLICVFVFAYAKSRFSHDEAHMF